jgi:hypothetical protein
MIGWRLYHLNQRPVRVTVPSFNAVVWIVMHVLRMIIMEDYASWITATDNGAKIA